MESASFSSAGATTLKAAIVATIAVVALASSGVLADPIALAALWLATVLIASPLRWVRVGIVPEGLVVERGFGVLTHQGEFIHESQIVKIQKVTTERLHLLLIATQTHTVKIDLSDLLVEDLVGALEARFGQVERAHVPFSLG